MRTPPATDALLYACDVLGVRMPVLAGDGRQSDRETWAHWKARTVVPSARFVPGRQPAEVFAARDLLLTAEVPAVRVRPVPTLRPAGKLAVRYGRTGFR